MPFFRNQFDLSPIIGRIEVAFSIDIPEREPLVIHKRLSLLPQAISREELYNELADISEEAISNIVDFAFARVANEV